MQYKSATFATPAAAMIAEWNLSNMNNRLAMNA